MHTNYNKKMFQHATISFHFENVSNLIPGHISYFLQWLEDKKFPFCSSLSHQQVFPIVWYAILGGLET